MRCDFVITQLRRLMYVNLTHKSVTSVSGTFVTLDSGLNTFSKGGISLDTLAKSAGWKRKLELRRNDWALTLLLLHLLQNFGLIPLKEA